MMLFDLFQWYEKYEYFIFINDILSIISCITECKTVLIYNSIKLPFSLVLLSDGGSMAMDNL